MNALVTLTAPTGPQDRGSAAIRIRPVEACRDFRFLPDDDGD